MQDFKKLLVWQKAHQFVLSVYAATENFPSREMYNLTSQLRRSSASIPANIAEGCGRGTDKELAYFFQIAMGSACEVEYHLLLAHDLKFLQPQSYESLNSHIIEVKKMLSAFIRKIRTSEN